MGLEVGDLLTVDPPQAGYPVRLPPALELLEPPQLARLGGDDELAAALGGDPPGLAVLVQLAGSRDAQLRLLRARAVVDAGVDDA
jgi:hypothetical protein